MKRLLYVLLAVAGLTGATILPSCTKNATFIPIKIFSTPLQALINSDTSLSVFYAAVKKANDSSMYGGTDSNTVLILTNTAFASQGITASTIRSMSAASADSLLKYYFIPGYDSIASGAYTLTNKLGNLIYAYKDSLGTYFNGISAARQSLLGSNAAVFELGIPLLPAASVASLIASDTTLGYFAEAIKHTNLNLVPSSGWNTILAPVDTAFVAAGYPTLGSIDSADVTALTNILQYHILPAQYFASGFAGLSTVTTLQGENINITFDLNGVTQFTGTKDTTFAVITVPNRIASGNIIIHNISRVLTP
jgi:uncharacterized surface protein with fasciclin (FAS1) repeats